MSAGSDKFKLSEWIFTTDHKRIGVLYLIGSVQPWADTGGQRHGCRQPV